MAARARYRARGTLEGGVGLLIDWRDHSPACQQGTFALVTGSHRG